MPAPVQRRPREITIPADAFAEAAEKGKLTKPLSKKHQNKIQRLLTNCSREYPFGFSQHIKQERKLLKTFAKQLAAVIGIMSSDEFTRWTVGMFVERLMQQELGVQKLDKLNISVGTLGRREMKRFKALHKWAVESEKEIALPPHRHPDDWIPDLMFALEAIYKEAGGKHTGVSRKPDGPRGGAFVEFAFAILSRLPDYMRPKSTPGESPIQALASRWESLRRDRKNGVLPRVIEIKIESGYPIPE